MLPKERFMAASVNTRWQASDCNCYMVRSPEYNPSNSDIRLKHVNQPGLVHKNKTWYNPDILGILNISLDYKQFRIDQDKIFKTKRNFLHTINTSYFYYLKNKNYYCRQGLVKGEKFCFRYLDFYFQNRESTSTASQLTSPASTSW